jgi:hypothetical protein
VAERAGRLATLALAILGVMLLLGAALNSNVQPDADAYWLAAQRLRDGQQLYAGGVTDETEIYRYAPWFAYAWIPMTYLGYDAAMLTWRGILLTATAAAVWPLVRRPTPAAITLAVLLGGTLVSNLPAANVTPLIIGLLVATLPTRLGPVLLGTVASLKIFPILFIGGFLAERRFVAAAVSTVVMSILWLHLLIFPVAGGSARLADADFYAGGVSLVGVSPILWIGVAAWVALLVLRFILERSPWAWLAVAAAIPLAVPRVWIPDGAYVLVGAAQVARARARQDGRGGT